MRRPVRILAIAVVLCFASLFLVASPASASERATRGQAQSILQAGDAGAVAYSHGVPAQWDMVAIHLLNPRTEFCALDWHMISLAFLEGSFTESMTQAQARLILQMSSITFELDGAPLATSATSVKRSMLFPDEDFVWYRTWGTVMSPQSIPVGQHTVQVTADYFGFPSEILEYSFTIDAAGTGACL